MGQAFNTLPPSERARRCRKRADRLLDLSLNARNTETIIAYLDLAAGMLAEARELEWDAEVCREATDPGSGSTTLAD